MQRTVMLKKINCLNNFFKNLISVIFAETKKLKCQEEYS